MKRNEKFLIMETVFFNPDFLAASMFVKIVTLVHGVLRRLRHLRHVPNVSSSDDLNTLSGSDTAFYHILALMHLKTLFLGCLGDLFDRTYTIERRGMLYLLQNHSCK